MNKHVKLQNLSNEAQRLRNITNARMTLGLNVDDRIRQEIVDITSVVWIKFIGTHVQYDNIDMETINDH